MVECERRPGQPEVLPEDRRASVQSAEGFAQPSAGLLAQRSLLVDNARFCAMVAVLALHTICAVPSILPLGVSPACVRLLSVWVKFGTIDFFIVSGFLLGEGFEQADPGRFVRRRVRKIFLPWMIWFALMSVGMAVHKGLQHHVSLTFNSLCFRVLATSMASTLTGTAFWFVPNLLVSLCVLLWFRKHVQRWWLGSVLLLISSFYAVNIYGRWVPSSHLVAIGGFAFFLWTGAMMSRHYERILRVSTKVSIWMVLLLVLATGWLSLGESSLLSRLRVPDPLNTLRFSNQLYSFAVMFLFVKLRIAVWPRLIDVRNRTFGIYLSHSLVLPVAVRLVKRALPHTSGVHGLQGMPGLLVISLVLTVSVFSVCAMLTHLIAEHGMGWLIGDLSRSRSKQPATLWAQVAQRRATLHPTVLRSR